MIRETIDNPLSIARRRGSIYLHVLSCSLLISILGLGALYAARIQVRSCRLIADNAQARACATSAIELGLLYIETESDWRSWTNGTWVDSQSLGSGTFTLQGTDPADSDLADSAYDAVVLTGIGTKGVTRHKVQVTVAPIVKTVEALTSAIQASGTVQVTGTLTVSGAPVCTNGQLDNDYIITGDAEAQSIATTGTITGTPTVPGEVKTLPDDALISQYAALGTTVTYSATREKFVLAPGYSTFGTTNADGVYVIDTGGANLTIQKCRLWGTLVILAGSGTVTIANPVFFQNYRSDYPVLLVSGNLVIKNTSASSYCTESTCATNLNPVGAPYNSITDTDKADSYSNRIYGLVHVVGTLSLQQTAAVTGAVICNGTVTVTGTNTVTYISSLYTSPPNGYTYLAGMEIAPGSWQELID